jgi:hypothetical protein
MQIAHLRVELYHEQLAGLGLDEVAHRLAVHAEQLG